MLIDTHCHLNFEAFESDWQEVVKRAMEVGVTKMIVVGTDVDTSRKAVEMAEDNTSLYAAVGIHPHHAKAFLIQDSRFKIQEEIKIIEELARHEKVVAIGEVGLDKHIYRNSKYGTVIADYDVQKKLLLTQTEIAKELNKPLILHSWEAGEDVLELARGWKGVFHCFEGSKKYLKRILEAGFYIGFTGNITYVPDRADVSVEVPLNRLFLETDCPYMTPEPHRRERNEPAYVTYTAEKHAMIRGISLDEVAQQTSGNAIELFNL